MSPKVKTRLVVRPELRVTPRLVLHARLLELDTVDTWQFLSHLSERHPVLEIALQDPFESRPRREPDLRRIYDGPPDPRVGYAEDEDRGDPVEASWISPQPGLWQRLEWQISLNFPEGTPEATIARAIVDHLGADGFLSVPPENLARSLGVKPEDVERVREVMVQHFDPPGVASRDILEFWRVWLAHHGLSEHPFTRFLQELTPDLLQDPEQLRSRVATLPEEVARDIQVLLEHLPSDPASVYETERVEYVIPDVLYRLVEGELIVEVNEPWRGHFRISPRYRELYENPDLDPETRKFLRAQFQEVEDILDALAERRRRLMDLAHFIADHQKDFLMGKTPRPAPLSRQRAVEALGIPHSTLSRLLKQKYADTPVGIFPLRFFFPTPLAAGTVSEEDLRELILSILEEEDPARPYTDEEIASRLATYGVHLSRRSVAHYRKKFGIPPRAQRRKRGSKQGG